MNQYAVRFRPIQKETAIIMQSAYDMENSDPVAAYSRLISAAVMAGAFLNLTPEEIATQVQMFTPIAHQAIADHPEMFGGMTKQ